MSIEHDQSTRKSLRVGIIGENALPTLDHFTVTNMTKTVIDQTGAPGSYWDRLMTADIQVTLDDLARESIASGGNASIWSVSEDGQIQIRSVSLYAAL